jgi:hypothetical protein
MEAASSKLTLCFFEADFMLLEVLRSFNWIGFKFHESLFHVLMLLCASQELYLA